MAKDSVTDEICDICWDDSKTEVPAVTITSGTPLCARHSTVTAQGRFPEDRETPGYKVLDRKADTPKVPKVALPNGKMPTGDKMPTPEVGQSKSSLVAQRGIKTGADFSQFMAALMEDLVDGTIKPEVATAACTAGGKILHMVELQMKYRASGKILTLTEGNKG
jgi:hypothetical protein